MMGEGPLKMAVWSYVLSHAYPVVEGGVEMGVVELNPSMVAFLIGGCTGEEVESVIRWAEGPDERSESKKEEGRRLVRMTQFIYRVVNFMEYRNRASNSLSAVKNREAVARHWNKKKRKRAKVNDSPH
jgi:hypothetical protein